MKQLKVLIVTGMVLSLWHLPSHAQDSVAERLADLERRIQYLEDRVATQDEVIIEKERQIAKLMEHGVQVEKEEGWFDAVEVGGLLEVEAAYENPYEGDNSSDAVLATMELAVTAQVTDWVGGEVVLLHEEDDTDLEVDVAIMTVGPAAGPWSFTAGQYFVPFGTFESNFISDPMTLELGETRESALQFGIESGRFQGAVYAFNGDSDEDGDDRFENLGAMIGFAAENENSEFAVNVSYISNIGDTDSLQDTIELDEDYDSVSGWSASGMLRFGSLTFLAEYLGASEDFEAHEMEFDGDGAEPSSYMLEAAYDFDLAGKSSTIAVGYQETDEALALELPEERFMLGFSIEMMEGVTLAVEGAFDDDYSVSDGGTGKDAEIVTVQLASEF
ncbi:MAG: LbtU family siderophore porin [Gammaproteobacteria bacterium]|nr:LbtU family siderophore porin [Gammaproteobacteria bacterium]